MSDTLEEFAPNCLRCSVKLEKVMNMPIRTGGTTGFWTNVMESSEEILTLEVYRCPKCRKVEFFDLDESLPKS